ncbi:MAG: hypothetical protein HZB72_02135 [Burkholderiales bacterium]|nr:hypothetical protein [Burkholderiales bacterium]
MLLRSPDEPWPAFCRRALMLLFPLIAGWLLLQLWSLAHDARAHQRARASIHDGYVRALQRCAADRPLQWDRCQAAAEASRRAALQLAELRYKGAPSMPPSTVLTLADQPPAQDAADVQPAAWHPDERAARQAGGAAVAARTLADFGSH